MKRKGRFDYILLETSGVADPGPIANMFWMDDGLAAEIYLDGIITVIDARNIVTSLDEVSFDECNSEKVSTAHIQIALADKIILNKIDTIEYPEQLSTIHKRIEGINSIAPVIDTSFSKVPLNEIFDIHAYESNPSLVDKSFHSHGWHDNVSTRAFVTITFT